MCGGYGCVFTAHSQESTTDRQQPTRSLRNSMPPPPPAAEAARSRRRGRNHAGTWRSLGRSSALWVAFSHLSTLLAQMMPSQSGSSSNFGSSQSARGSLRRRAKCSGVLRCLKTRAVLHVYDPRGTHTHTHIHTHGARRTSYAPHTYMQPRNDALPAFHVGSISKRFSRVSCLISNVDPRSLRTSASSTSGGQSGSYSTGRGALAARAMSCPRLSAYWARSSD